MDRLKCVTHIVIALMILLLAVGCAETAKVAEVAEVAVAAPTRPPLEVSQEGLDLVLQGGGAKGLAHIGAIREIELQERPFRRIVGTSAGSIVAVLLAAGFSAAEMQSAITERTPDGNIIMGSFLTPPEASEFTDEILRDSITFLTLQDVVPDFLPDAAIEEFEINTLRTMLEQTHFREMFSVVEMGGLYSGTAFVEWLRGHLNANGRDLGDATLAEFHQATGVDLTIVAANADDRTLLMLNHRTAPDLPVVWAVRMSSSIPFVFQEVLWQPEWGAYLGRDLNGMLVVDGGMITNLPLELVISQEEYILEGMVLEPRPEMVIGLVLDHESSLPGITARPTPKPQVNTDEWENAQLAQRWAEIGRRNLNLIDTLLNAHDYLIARSYPEHICSLPVAGVETLEYDMSDEKIEILLNGAQLKMRECLEKLEG